MLRGCVTFFVFVLIATNVVASERWWHILGENAEVLLENMLRNSETIHNLKSELMIFQAEEKSRYLPSVSLEASYSNNSYSEDRRRVSMPIVFKIPYGNNSYGVNAVAARIEVNKLINDLLLNYTHAAVLKGVHKDLDIVLNNLEYLESNYRDLYVQDPEYGEALDRIILDKLQTMSRLEEIQCQIDECLSNMKKIFGINPGGVFDLNVAESLEIAQGLQNLDVLLAKAERRNAIHEVANKPEVTLSLVPFCENEIECEYELGVSVSWNIFDGRSVIRKRKLNLKGVEIVQNKRFSLLDRELSLKNHKSLRNRLKLIKDRGSLLSGKMEKDLALYRSGGDFSKYLESCNTFYQCQIEIKEIQGTILTNYIESFKHLNYEL